MARRRGRGGVGRTGPGYLVGRGRPPWRPPPIPSGYYDPALDAQLAATQRGYGDVRQDLSLAGTRAAADYGIQVGNLRQAERYTNEDYATRTQGLARSFGILANQQRNRAAAQGVLSGGLALLAAQKRAANQQVQQTAIDTAHARSVTGLEQQIGAAGLTYNRGVSDRATQLARAGRETTQFGLDTEAQRAYQAQQAGYVAPTRPTAVRVPMVRSRPSAPASRPRRGAMGWRGWRRPLTPGWRG